MEELNERACPFCRQAVDWDAETCPHCRETLREKRAAPPPRRRRPRDLPDEDIDPAVGLLIPINTNGWAIVAGYCGLLSFFPVIGILFAILGIFASIRTFRAVRANPRLGGKGRAIFGLVASIISLFYNIPVTVLIVIGITKG